MAAVSATIGVTLVGSVVPLEPSLAGKHRSVISKQVLWCGHFSLKQRKFNTLRLVATANTQDSQNVDLPSVLPKRRKKPSLVPKQTRKRRIPVKFENPTLKPPANGLLVNHLIPVAHDVMQAKAIAAKGVRRLMEELPVLACRFCIETHIGPVGHNLKTCKGPGSSSRHGAHDWLKGSIDDVLVPREAYHLADRFAKPITHEERFDVDRIDAVEELCIQAGVELPEYPTKRYTEPVVPSTRRRRQDANWLGGAQFTFYTNEGSYLYTDKHDQEGRKLTSRVGSNDGVDTQTDYSEGFETASNDGDPSVDRQQKIKNRFVQDVGSNDGVDTQTDYSEVFETASNDGDPWEDRQQKIKNRFVQDDPANTRIDDSRESQAELIEPLVDVNSEDDLRIVAQKTLQAWERMREGCQKLILKYRVVTCGYCPEIHVGPRGHRSKACGAFKHQWRDGKHGWQDASINDLIPPQYVWHLRDRLGPPLDSALMRYYGKAPALVELCVQAGAPVPENHAALMRLDIAIPTLTEIENVI